MQLFRWRHHAVSPLFIALRPEKRGYIRYRKGLLHGSLLANLQIMKSHMNSSVSKHE